LFVDRDQMMSQELSQRRGKQRDAILAPLSVPDDQLLSAEVDVLDPQAQSFEKAQTGPVQQAGVQLLDAGHLVQDRRDLAAGQDDGDAVGTLGVNNVRQPIDLPAQDLLVQEQQPGQGLILCRRGDAAIHRQHGQEGADLGLTQVVGMAFAVEENEPPDPGDVGLFRSWAHVPRPDCRADAIEKSRPRADQRRKSGADRRASGTGHGRLSASVAGIRSTKGNHVAKSASCRGGGSHGKSQLPLACGSGDG
jgi:hypothetical protein